MSLTVGLLARHTPNGPLGRSAALIDIAQDLLLGHLVGAGMFEHLVFKGGTALRKVYAGNAGRFSTDLDFSLLKAGEDPAVIQELLTDTINGTSVDGFTYTVELRRERPTVLYETPFGPPGALTTKLDVGPPVWLDPVERPWVRLPVHKAYDVPDSVPVMALEENIAEKVARLNRLTPARDVYDLVWVATTSPHSQFDRALVRRLAILKCWVDAHGLSAPSVSWVGPPGADVLNLDSWLRPRSLKEFDDESIGVLATPAPDLSKLAADLRDRFGFLGEPDAGDRRLLACGPGDRSVVIAAIQALPGSRFSDVALW